MTVSKKLIVVVRSKLSLSTTQSRPLHVAKHITDWHAAEIHYSKAGDWKRELSGYR